MKKLVPLFALFTSACGPATLDRELKDIPGPTILTRISSFSDQTDFYFGFDWDRDSPCYRIPEDTRLTANGDSYVLEARGESSLSFDGVSSCKKASFRGPVRPASETRTELVLTDGHSSKRVVFQSLHAERRIQVKGQEQAPLRVGEVVELEWLPATDRLTRADAHLEVEGSGQSVSSLEDLQVEGSHLRFTLPQVRPGRYVVSVYGQGNAGVEACDGFIACDALVSERVEVTVVVE
ncbi:peptidase associated/transthyretin-like domain-containing protein [Archangium lipolyticum]|uniref:hypothetical protein n=1 Tax=Archangium lipolyticum TaxID=2970465 RepID=UPI00214A7D25|nr:hypothetical protein [Archangium lipolyticum]